MKRRLGCEKNIVSPKTNSLFGIIPVDVMHKIFSYFFDGYSESHTFQFFTSLRFVCKDSLQMMKQQKFGEFVKFDCQNFSSDTMKNENIQRCLFNMNYTSIDGLNINQNLLVPLLKSGTLKIRFLLLTIDFSIFQETTLNLKKLEFVDTLFIYFTGRSDRKTCNIKLPKIVNDLTIDRDDDKSDRFRISKISGGKNLRKLSLRFVNGDPCMWREYFKFIAPTLCIFQFGVLDKKDLIDVTILRVLENVECYACVMSEDENVVNLSGFPKLTHLCVGSRNVNLVKTKLIGPDYLKLTSFHIVEPEFLEIPNLRMFKHLKDIGGSNCGSFCCSEAME